MDARIVRNGSRGMFWLEPMLEVETPKGRVAYGPVSAKDVPSLFDAGLGLVAHNTHPLSWAIRRRYLFSRSSSG